MKRRIGILLVGASLILCTQDPVSPPDPNEIIWTKAQSPIILDDKFVVEKEQLLTIEAGVEIRLKSSTHYIDFGETDIDLNDFNYDSLVVGMLHIKGRINAIGTPSEPIRFNRSGNTGHWGCIFIDSTAQECELAHCHLAHGYAVMSLKTPLFAYGMLAFHSAYGEISHCEFTGSHYVNLFFDGRANPLIADCAIRETSLGLYCAEVSSPTIRHSAISQNKTGIMASHAYSQSNRHDLWPRSAFC